jgi:hypothetical protein
MTDEVRIAEVERKLEREHTVSDFEFYREFLTNGHLNMREFREKIHRPETGYNDFHAPLPTDEMYVIWREDAMGYWTWEEVRRDG